MQIAYNQAPPTNLQPAHCTLPTTPARIRHFLGHFRTPVETSDRQCFVTLARLENKRIYRKTQSFIQPQTRVSNRSSKILESPLSHRKHKPTLDSNRGFSGGPGTLLGADSGNAHPRISRAGRTARPAPALAPSCRSNRQFSGCLARLEIVPIYRKAKALRDF
jgi:hypothetical protein